MFHTLFRYLQEKTHLYSGLLTFISTLILIVIFVVLAYKSPYSDRTLISNLEPYPDTLYYSTPAWNVVHGKPFSMTFNNYTIKLETPPLYSIYLIPFFVVTGDVRSYYYANLLLAIATIIIFIKAMRILFSGVYSVILVSFLGFLYVTNYSMYTLPSLLMAENLSLFLVSVGIYLLVAKPSSKTAIFSPITSSCLVLTKLSNIPFAIVICLFLALKHLKNKKLLSIFLSTFLLCAGVSLIYFYSSHFLEGHKNLSEGSSFSMLNIKSRFTFYSKAIMGQRTTFLWIHERFILPIISILAGMGLFVGALHKKYRFMTICIVMCVASLLVFMSGFQWVESRYIFIAYPFILIAVGVLLHGISHIKYSRFIVGSVIVLVIMQLIAFKNTGYIHNQRGIITFKKQIGLNFKYSETPWNYKAVEHFNSYFSANRKNKPILATFLPPFYINYFSKKTYEYAPLSIYQEFFWMPKGLGHQMGIGSIESYLEKKFAGGQEVYLSNAYVGNLVEWSDELEKLKKKFNAKRVSTGCLDTCSIYRLTTPLK